MSNEKPCRCPTRPYFTLGSFGSGSAMETAAVDKWTREHGEHPFAKARDLLSGSLQQAESAVGSGVAVLDMVHDVFNLPRSAQE